MPLASLAKRAPTTDYRLPTTDHSVQQINFHFPPDLDIIQVVMVYIGDGERDLGNRLLNLLSELFKSEDNARTKMSKLKENYHIDLNQDEEGMVDTMCNLSVGVYERAWDKGWNKGWNDSLHQERERKKRQLIPDLWEMHMDIPMIAKLAECSEEEVCEMVKDMGLA